MISRTANIVYNYDKHHKSRLEIKRLRYQRTGRIDKFPVSTKKADVKGVAKELKPQSSSVDSLCYRTAGEQRGETAIS